MDVYSAFARTRPFDGSDVSTLNAPRKNIIGDVWPRTHVEKARIALHSAVEISDRFVQSNIGSS